MDTSIGISEITYTRIRLQSYIKILIVRMFFERKICFL